MPILVIRNLWAIKMHHWGPKELVVGAGYRLNKEKTILLRGMPPQFLTDKEETKGLFETTWCKNCVVCVQSTCTTRLNLAVKTIQEIPVVYHVGSQQRCSIGCRVGGRFSPSTGSQFAFWMLLMKSNIKVIKVRFMLQVDILV